MRMNYDTFTGRRSSFIALSSLLLVLFFITFNFLGQAILKPVVQGLTKHQAMAAGMVLPYMAVIGIVVFSALVTERKRSFWEKMGLKPEADYPIQRCAGMFCVMLLVIFGLEIGLTALLKHFNIEPPEQGVVSMFRGLPVRTFLAFGVITVIFAPIAEELAFRHVLYRLFRIIMYRKEATVAISLLFALMHLPLGEKMHVEWSMLVMPTIPLFFLAMFFQQEYERSRSVIPSILMHAGFNFATLLMLAWSVYNGASL